MDATADAIHRALLTGYTVTFEPMPAGLAGILCRVTSEDDTYRRCVQMRVLTHDAFLLPEHIRLMTDQLKAAVTPPR